MYMNYTFFSRILNAEETITVLLPDVQSTINTRYSIQSIHDRKVSFPLLIAMGEEGRENTWLSRTSNTEIAINSFDCACGLVLLRGMPYADKSLTFVRDELPVILCSSFPFDRNELYWFSCKSSGVYANLLSTLSPYKRVFSNQSENGSVYSLDGTCKDAIRQAIRLVGNKG